MSHTSSPPLRCMSQAHARCTKSNKVETLLLYGWRSLSCCSGDTKPRIRKVIERRPETIFSTQIIRSARDMKYVNTPSANAFIHCISGNAFPSWRRLGQLEKFLSLSSLPRCFPASVFSSAAGARTWVKGRFVAALGRDKISRICHLVQNKQTRNGRACHELHASLPRAAFLTRRAVINPQTI
jgi:hypothetical protein